MENTDIPKRAEKMDLSIITVTHQSIRTIDLCITSVIASTLNCTYEHIIIDNGSTDGTPEFLEKAYLNSIRLIKNSQNVGFSAANNQAVKEAKGRYLLFLNPDMNIQKGYLDNLIEVMDQRPDVGLLGCKLVTPWLAPQPWLFPVKLPSLFSYLVVSLRLRPFYPMHPSKWYFCFSDTSEQEVEAIRGSFMCMRREVMETLGFAFDPRYFLLYEDVDLCKEMQRLGYKILYHPHVTCIDYCSWSMRQYSPPWSYLRMLKGIKIYVSKWYSPLHLLWLSPMFALDFVLRIPRWGIKNSLKALCWKRPYLT